MDKKLVLKEKLEYKGFYKECLLSCPAISEVSLGEEFHHVLICNQIKMFTDEEFKDFFTFIKE